MDKQKKLSFQWNPSFKLVAILFCLGAQSACSLFQEKIQTRQAKETPSIQKKFMPESKSSLVQIKKLEATIGSRREVDQYSKALPWFETDEEKSEFLRLPDFESKQAWLNEKNFGQRAQKVQAEMEDLVAAKDIAIGMPAQLVKRSWGEPDSVEVSGNPQFKNERWKYNKYISSNDGYKAEKKIVYFEGGRVVGWEIE